MHWKEHQEQKQIPIKLIIIKINNYQNLNKKIRFLTLKDGPEGSPRIQVASF